MLKEVKRKICFSLKLAITLIISWPFLLSANQDSLVKPKKTPGEVSIKIHQTDTGKLKTNSKYKTRLKKKGSPNEK
jgi:hypothetical protein